MWCHISVWLKSLHISLYTKISLDIFWHNVYFGVYGFMHTFHDYIRKFKDLLSSLSFFLNGKSLIRHTLNALKGSLGILFCKMIIFPSKFCVYQISQGKILVNLWIELFATQVRCSNILRNPCNPWTKHPPQRSESFLIICVKILP